MAKLPLAAPSTHRCASCKEHLSLDRFTAYAIAARAHNALCRSCRSLYSIAWKSRNVEKVSRWRREYREANTAGVARLQRMRTLRKYGLTIEGYDSILSKQNGVCAICAHPERVKGRVMALAVDHDHETGKVRGLLCQKCNVSIGHFNDSPVLLRKAIDYLEGARQ